MEQFSALLQFFEGATKEGFLKFWSALPLGLEKFWQALWEKIWTREGDMAFTSAAFWIFLAVCAALYYLCPRRVKPFWLLCCSYAFYLYNRSGVSLVAVLVGATVITWCCGLAVEKLKNVWGRRAFLLAAILTCGGLLFVYKYLNFLNEAAAGVVNFFGGDVSAILYEMPAILGLSYFTFQSLGYVVDVYQKVCPAEKNPLYYALYVSFFPCIVTGPIERAGHLLPQLRNPKPFSYPRVAGGVYRMLWGMFKKMVIADNIAPFTKYVFQNMKLCSGPTLAVGALAFSYQLYADFSGYCDIAIGAGQVLGFDLLENFQRPFAARTYTQLWDRWHISLTSWFRDYIFTPLSFYNRGLAGRLGRLQGWFNVFIIFPISGLWHGAAMGYIIWGALNGLFLVVGKATAKKRRKLAKKNPLYRLKFLKALIQCSIVYLLFTVCIVFFASSMFGGDSSDALYLFTHLFTGWGGAGAALTVALSRAKISLVTVWVVALCILFVEALEKLGKPGQLIRKLWFVVRWPLYYLLLVVMLLFAQFGGASSMYQNY